MPNLSNIEKPSGDEGDLHSVVTGEDKKVDHTAEKAATKAQKTEKRYDQDHNIFTK